MRRLEGKTAVITGCNRGIGRAILEKFASEGANVIACTRTVSDELLADYKEVESKSGVKIYSIQMDLSEQNEVKSGIKEIFSLKTPVDILVNNAGMATFEGILRVKLEKLAETFQVNYFSLVQLTQGLLMLLAKSKSASIINMTSIAGMDGAMGNSAYGASKASVSLLTKCLSKELSRQNIRVNAIAAGFIETDMQSYIADDVKRLAIETSVMKRFGKPEEVANVALFLASDESSFITGQIIRVDGGV